MLGWPSAVRADFLRVAGFAFGGFAEFGFARAVSWRDKRDARVLGHARQLYQTRRTGNERQAAALHSVLAAHRNHRYDVQPTVLVAGRGTSSQIDTEPVAEVAKNKVVVAIVSSRI